MFKGFVSAWRKAPAALSPGTVVCAVGDVHGCLGHLKAMLAFLESDILRLPDEKGDRHLVLIGDFIDRGPDSLGTLAFLDALRRPGTEITTLLGNHDFYLALIAGDEPVDMEFIETWSDWGGASTLAELGLSRDDLYHVSLDAIRAQIRRKLGAAAIAFLGRLRSYRRLGTYVFVHAGIDPGLPPEAHGVDDLIMIREPFLTGTDWTHDFAVVHGHTIRGHEATAHRIAVDTGAFRTGILSCVQLVGDGMRWIAVTDGADLDPLALLPCVSGAPTYEGPFAIAEPAAG